MNLAYNYYCNVLNDNFLFPSFLLHFFFKELLTLFIYLFIYFWLCWVFVSMQGFSLVVASGGHSSLRCTGLSLSWPLLLRGTGSRRAGSVVVAHGPSCFAACGIFPDHGSNPCPLHWQADSQPLRHQGSPQFLLHLLMKFFCKIEFSLLRHVFSHSFIYLYQHGLIDIYFILEVIVQFYCSNCLLNFEGFAPLSFGFQYYY